LFEVILIITDHLSLQKCQKYAILTLSFEKFSGGISPDPILRRDYGALPRHHPEEGT